MKLLLPIFAVLFIVGCGAGDQPLPQGETTTTTMLYQGESAQLGENDTVAANEENTTVSYYYLVDTDEKYIKVDSGSVVLTKN